VTAKFFVAALCPRCGLALWEYEGRQGPFTSCVSYHSDRPCGYRFSGTVEACMAALHPQTTNSTS
jgi:hypothetical protein